MAARNVTSTLTINAAFLQEIKEVNEELWKLLAAVRDMCWEVPVVHSNRRKLADGLGELRDQLAMHFALEEAYGYFENPVDVAPQLSTRASTLREEHSNLYAFVSDLVEFVESEQHEGHFAAAAPQVSERFRAFYKQFQSHESNENELILQAYDDDIGVGD